MDHSTQIAYVQKAIEMGYDVLVSYTNNNYRNENGKRIHLEQNQSPDAHTASVLWNKLIAPIYHTIETFTVVAHGYGGSVTLRMADDNRDKLLAKCFAVVFIGATDSMHYSDGLSREMRDWFHKVIKFIRSIFFIIAFYFENNN